MALNNQHNENLTPDSKKSFQRLPAVKVLISDIINGQYIKEEGWTPNYIMTPKNKKVSRINIIGVVISKETFPSYENMIIDDGSSSIAVRNFENIPKFGDLKVGEIVLVIGRPRLYGAELYVIPEILKKQESIKWVELRRAELGFKNDNKKSVENNKSMINQKKDNAEKSEQLNFMTDSEKIISIIRSIDKGDGASFDDILRMYKKSNGELIIAELMQLGEIFEIKPGKIKVLE